MLDKFLALVSMIGWSMVLFSLATVGQASVPALLESGEVMICELACVSEVLRMLLPKGMPLSLRGNLVVGAFLHAARTLVLLQFIPRLGPDHTYIAYLILVAWAATEVFRYPFYIVRASATKVLRYGVPLLTFPLGAGGEAAACVLYITSAPSFFEVVGKDASHWYGVLHVLAGIQVLINTLGGTLVAYPGMVKSAGRAFGLLPEKRKKKKKEEGKEK